MLVYRDSRTRVPAHELVRRLQRTLASLGANPTGDALLDALLRAGELECALCDANSRDSDAAIAVSDLLASFGRHADTRADITLQNSQQLLSTIRYDGELAVSRPEGFAYYALHPLDFADLASTAELRSAFVYVIGIRSIGTTLSAVVAAKLNADGIHATRMTVRPTGHPYDRQTTFTGVQSDAIRQTASGDALFLICDEGPG